MNPEADRPTPSPADSSPQREPGPVNLRGEEGLEFLEFDSSPSGTNSDDLPILTAASESPNAEPVVYLVGSDEADSPATPTVGRFRLPNAGWALLWMLLLLGSQLVAGLVVGVLFAAIALAEGPIQSPNDLAERINSKQDLLNWVLFPLATVLTLGTAVATVWLAFRRESARCVGLRGLTWTQTLLVLLSVLPCAMLASEVTNYASELMPNVSLDLFGNFAQESWWLVFVAACLFPGIGEELFFRGFLSRGLLAHHGAWLGTLITAFYFGAIHLHPIQACGAFALGIALQFVFLTTRSLWGAVLLHTANNSIAFLAMRHGDLVPIPGFTTNSSPEPVAEGVPVPNVDPLIEALNGNGSIAHTPPLLLLTATVAAAAIAWGLWRTRTRWLRPDGSEWSRGFVSAEGPRPEIPVQTVSGRLDAVTGAVVCVANALFFAEMVWQIQR
jgi:membrane protease YdiL (CAAX protease family)